MKILETAREEIAKAPLGTVGAVAGVVTLIIDLWPTSGANAASSMTAKEKFALAFLSSTVVCFVFSYLFGRYVDRRSISSKFLYIIAASVAALISNSQFQTRFPSSSTWSLASFTIMFLVGIVLSGLYFFIYLENMNRQWWGNDWTTLEFSLTLIMAIVQVFIIADGVRLFD